jgi:hypothetical protein
MEMSEPIFEFVKVVTGEHSADCPAAVPGMAVEEELRHEHVGFPVRS